MSAFYENYVKLCALHNLSESGAAKKIGLSNAAANGWKKGKMPSATTQVKLTDLFGVSVKELMGETDDPSAGIKKERPADGEARVCDLPESIQKIINICLDRPELASALLTLAQQIEKG
jgi:transcriptional regulator with XRE-family HTH domain